MRDKYEREIEELLERLDKSNRFVQQEPRRRRRGPGWFDRLGRNIRTLKVQFTPGWLMLAAAALVLISIFLRPVEHGLAGMVALLGVLLFFGAYALSFRRNSTPRLEPRWRGRIIQLPRRNSWRYKLSRWLRRRRTP